MKKLFQISLYVLAICALSAPAFAQTTLTAVDGSATLDGVLSAGEWTGQSMLTTAGVTLYAMGDGEFLYMAAQWTDATTTESINKNMWTYDGTTWTKSGNEDRFAFIWDMGLNGTEGANCTTMCHGSTMGTSTGMVDAWHWKAARGGTTMGVVDDKHWLAEDDGRHSDSGTSAYMSNSLDSNGNPTYMPSGGHGMMGVSFMGADQTALDFMNGMTSHSTAMAVAFDPAAGWVAGDMIPGYVMRTPGGDRGNVHAMGKYDNGVWTVEFMKPYAGSAGDFTVIPGLAGSSVNFTHDSFDNTGGGHVTDGSFDATVYTLDFSALSPASNELAVTTGTATLDGVFSADEWTSKALVTDAGVSMYSMADGNDLYVAAQWVDFTGTENVNKNMWTFDGAAWTKSGNEDRFGIIWDMGLNGTEGANCTTMCHVATGEMKTSTGKVDTWHWKAARGMPMGVVDDKIWDTTGRHSDPGTSAYSDNSLDGAGNPTFMQSGGAGTAATFLASTQAALDIMTPLTSHASALAVAFDATGWVAGETVPGYVLRVADGDRASVSSRATYSNGVWTVEFKKPYAGGDNDFTVTAGSSVNFTHDSFDNTGGNHFGDGTFDATVYTLDFATILATGIDGLIADEIPAEYQLEQNYPNPFNPVTKIRFQIAEHQRVSLNVFDSLGRLVKTLMDSDMLPGQYDVNFSGQNLASGIYFYQLTTLSGVQTRQMVLLK